MLNDKIILKDIVIKGNRCEYDCAFPSILKSFMDNPDEKLFMEYDFDLEGIPKSVLAIPFVSTVFTYGMFDNICICVEELDKKFYESIGKILQHFKFLCPDLEINCKIKAKKLVDNYYIPEKRYVIAFTGGVDATSAVATHINDGRDITLCNVFGGDIPFENKFRHDLHERYYKKFALDNGFNYSQIKSNLRYIFNEDKIKRKDYFGHDFWAKCACVPSLIGVISLLCYKLKAEKLIIGSSYPRIQFDKRRIVSSEYYKILDDMFFCSTDCIQADPDMYRSDKIKNIIDVFHPDENHKLILLACWNMDNDNVKHNCSHCEKCYRTIMNITACNQDPNNFGFEVTDETYAEIRRYVTWHYVNEFMWEDIKNHFLMNKNLWKHDERVNWIFYVKINGNGKYSLLYRLKNRIKRILKRSK